MEPSTMNENALYVDFNRRIDPSSALPFDAKPPFIRFTNRQMFVVLCALSSIGHSADTNLHLAHDAIELYKMLNETVKENV